ncbi:MAG: hypothetical protein ACI9V1_000038 [Spirosomataceae bacterium]
MKEPSQAILPIFEVKDDRFEIGQIASCHLLIEVSKDRFRFAIQHEKNDMFMWMEDYQIMSVLNENQLLQTLQQIYDQHHFLAANYWKSVSLSVNSNYFTFIPDEIFQQEDSSKYINFAAGSQVNENHNIYDFKHSAINAFNVFGVEKKLINWFKEMYTVKKITPVHLISTLIECIRQLPNPDGMHIHFEEGNLIVVCFKDNILQFCNRFNYRTPQDAAYHVLFVINQLSLNAATPLTLYGEITTFSEVYALIFKTMTSISFGKMPENLNFSYFFEDMPEHRYCSLFSMLYTY